MANTSEPIISIESFAHSLSAGYLACRELGHVWKPFTATYDGEARVIDRRLRCNRCKTQRVQLITMAGHVISNHYKYADGYQAKNVEKGVRYSRDQFRIEAVTRFLEKTKPE
jgi:hypothetical protein